MPSFRVIGWGTVCGLLVAVPIVGCAGPQSALDPAGYQAQQIAQLWWWMFAGAITIWLIMMALSYYAIFAKRGRHYQRITAWVVIGGGVIFPTLVLTGLLCYGLSLLPPLLARPPAGSLVIEVEGAQWWWRVTYSGLKVGSAADLTFETANEICLPVDQPTEFRLKSHDVIHAFWIPALAGKVDMIPGRDTRLAVHPYRVATLRGACAEYCGDSHALMNFNVEIVEAKQFETWLEHQLSHAVEPKELEAQRGKQLFHSSGCGACHMIRGGDATGRVGPDLTHVGSRKSIGAGMTPNTRDSMVAWLRSTEHLKPGVHMPNFEALGETQLLQLAAYLEQLQ